MQQCKQKVANDELYTEVQSERDILQKVLQRELQLFQWMTFERSNSSLLVLRRRRRNKNDHIDIGAELAGRNWATLQETE